MPLFRDQPIRALGIVGVTLFLGHYVVTNLLSSTFAYHLTQTSVAILALSGLIALVTIHHRRDGHLLNQTQEEMILIAGVGLIWIAILVAWRGLRGGHAGHAGSPPTPRAMSRGNTGNFWPCDSDVSHCVVEDYTYW